MLNKYLATIIAIGASLALLLPKTGARPIWQIIWPVFGSANQLVAALALLGVGVWVKRGLRKNNIFLMLPMGFMLATTIAALILLVRDQIVGRDMNILLMTASVVLIPLAVLMVREAMKALRQDAASHF